MKRVPKAAVTFVIRLKPAPGCHDPVRALRFALKSLLRQYGLKTVSVETEEAGGRPMVGKGP